MNHGTIPEGGGEMWAGDGLDGPPPIEIRKGRRSRFKFTMTPQWVLLMPDLPHAAFRLYCVLLAHANAERGDGRVWPQQRTLAELMGYSRRASIDPLLKALQKFSLIDVEEIRYGQNNSRCRNVYTVHEEPPPEWDGLASVQEFYAEKRASAEAESKAAADSAPDKASGQREQAPAAASAPRTGEGKPRAAAPKKPVPKRKDRDGRLSRHQAAALRTVEAALPAELQALLPKYRPKVLREVILEALDSRTAEQVAQRVRHRWWAHGYAADALTGGRGISSPVGVAVGLVRPSADCPDPMCEDGTTLDTGEPCRTCAERRADRKTGQGRVPVQRSARHEGSQSLWECAECRDPLKGERPPDGLCASCRTDADAAGVAARQLAQRLASEEAGRAQLPPETRDVMSDEAYAEPADERRAAGDQENRERRRLEEDAEPRRLCERPGFPALARP